MQVLKIENVTDKTVCYFAEKTDFLQHDKNHLNPVLFARQKHRKNSLIVKLIEQYAHTQAVKVALLVAGWSDKKQDPARQLLNLFIYYIQAYGFNLAYMHLAPPYILRTKIPFFPEYKEQKH